MNPDPTIDYTQVATPDGVITIIQQITIGDIMTSTILLAIGIFIVLKTFFFRGR